MTDKQRFLVYVKLGNLLADICEKNGVGICEAMRILLDRDIIQKLEDLETGYYLEGSAYLAEVFEIRPCEHSPEGKRTAPHPAINLSQSNSQNPLIQTRKVEPDIP